jgi:hypothetical protein
MKEAMALLMNAAEYLGTPPDGPPTNVGKYTYSGTKIGFDWTNGDIDAQLQVSRDGGSTVFESLAPKTTSWPSDLTQTAWDAAGYSFAVRHIDGIYTTSWAVYSLE